ncbi:MAG: nucleoside phosphorylase [Bacteroidaceae bacterium]|nr:nucleoside phosphorylase [Bacteroidaceae bacterium]
MEDRYFAPSELIINEDGSVFHLHLKPEQLADKIILVGDPGRVDMITSYFDTIECSVSNREFRTVTGCYKGKRISVQATGIGCDNIDIVMNEIDALANIDFITRKLKPQLRKLDIVRIGTCGGLQPYTPLGTYLCSVKSIGFDGLLNYYGGSSEVCDIDFERAFCEYMQWSERKPAPYVIDADTELLERIMTDDDSMVPGVTIACGGFYGPQGRVLRIPLSDPDQNSKIENFEYNGYKITNFEMESSAVAGMAKLLGHRAMTVCLVIANRYAKEMNTDYHSLMEQLVIKVLDRI